MTLQCQLYIDVNVLQYEQSIPYKYFVYSSSTTEGNSAYEFLHGVTELRGKIVNRCLLVPISCFRSEGNNNIIYVCRIQFFMGAI